MARWPNSRNTNLTKIFSICYCVCPITLVDSGLVELTQFAKGKTMAKFILKQTQLCYVDWFYEIEADDEESAMDKFYDGEHDDSVGLYVGDSSDMPTSHITTESYNEHSETRTTNHRPQYSLPHY